MRALGYLADEIEGAIAANDGDRARQKLTDLRSQAKRVSSMLSALLHYASAGRGDASIESVDTRELVEEIVRSLPRGTVEVTLQGPWPRLDTAAAPFALTLRNLIDNTIKHHDRERGKLLITCVDQRRQRCHPQARRRQRARRRGDRGSRPQSVRRMLRRLVLREALALLQARGIVPNVCAIFSVWCSVAARTPPSFRSTPVVLPLPQFE